MAAMPCSFRYVGESDTMPAITCARHATIPSVQPRMFARPSAKYVLFFRFLLSWFLAASRFLGFLWR
jgi:hypothetical protein